MARPMFAVKFTKAELSELEFNMRMMPGYFDSRAYEVVHAALQRAKKTASATKKKVAANAK